jgi:hypothetical protein
MNWNNIPVSLYYCVWEKTNFNLFNRIQAIWRFHLHQRRQAKLFRSKIIKRQLSTRELLQKQGEKNQMTEVKKSGGSKEKVVSVGFYFKNVIIKPIEFHKVFPVFPGNCF